jgi:hypothetical protein
VLTPCGVVALFDGESQDAAGGHCRASPPQHVLKLVPVQVVQHGVGQDSLVPVQRLFTAGNEVRLEY